jgi:dTDP-4-amino-4,6-dideoxygalactose transaminase
MNNNVTRRSFVQTAAAAGSAALAWLGTGGASQVVASEAGKPALLGGTPAHKGGWPGWPSWRESWEPAIIKALRSGNWSRGTSEGVPEFEKAYAKLLGAKRCLATASGTTSLMIGLHVMGVDAGDEVIVSPYTFIATYNAILSARALPVFADTDPATLTMDPTTIESRITDRTRAILPVHIFGMPCDMDAINAIARKHNLAVVEDACQAWMADYKGKKCGTLGDIGCFSFQNSKHIPSGEGGAVTAMSDELIDRANSFHNCGRAFGTNKGHGSFTRGLNYRMTRVQGLLLLQQIDKLVQETIQRRENADRLTAGLKKIPGILPARLPENSAAVWHLYPFRYDPVPFNGLPHGKFVRALNAEGIPCSGGVYSEQYFDGLLDEAIASRGFRRLFSDARLKAYRDSLQDLKGNKQVCQTTVAMTQSMLLADPQAIDHIVEAVGKIHAHSAELVKKA